jgi:uncharacterized protein YoxC
MAVLPTTGPARRRILTPYVMIWLAIASFAIAYLALLGLRPHMLATTAKGPDVDQKIAQVKRDVQRGLADLDPLRRTVGEVKMDVDNLKVAAEEASQRDQMILEKVTALENSAVKAPETGSVTKTSKTIPPAVALPPAPKQNPRKSMATDSTGGARVINTAQKARNIETGSIERKSKKAAAKAAVPVTPVGMLVATGPSVDALRLNWSILNDRHGNTVRNLQPRYVVNGTGNYGLIVGPIASTAAAQALCTDLASKGVDCKVSSFRGNAL